MFVIVLVFLSIFSYASATTASQMKVLKDVLNPEFDRLIRPGGDDPLRVAVTIYLLEVHHVDLMKQEFEMRIYYRMFWNDTRLKYNDNAGKVPVVNIPIEILKTMWHPDAFFLLAKETTQQDSIYTNVLGKFEPSGTIKTSRLLTIKQECPMDLRRFPFETIVCTAKIGSYGHTTEDVILEWQGSDAFAASYAISLYEYRVFSSKLSDDCSVDTGSGSYSCIGFQIIFQHTIPYYLKSFFLPGITFVSVSWLVFWFNSAATDKRLTYLLTCFGLQLVFIVRSMLLRPSVSYLTAMDYWNGICLFTFFAELLLVIKVGSDVSPPPLNKLEKRESITASPLVESEDTNTLASPAPAPAQSCPAFCPNFLQFTPRGIDIIARISFPVCYYVAVIIYFNYYTS